MKLRRWVPWVLGCALVATACEGRPRMDSATDSSDDEKKEPRPGKIMTLDLSGGAPESMASGGFFGVPARRTFVGLVRTLERALEDEDATGFFVKLGSARFGFARSEEIGRGLAKLREAEKPVVCHAHSLSNASVGMALTGCDRVWLSPAGDVDSVGIAGQTVYFKRVLDRFKVQADFLQMGKYKSFAETFTREGPTDEARESLVGTLRSLRASWLADVEAAAGKKGRGAVEQGPWTPNQAKERGLVHAVGYESQALEDAEERGNGEDAGVVFGRGATPGNEGLVELIRLLTGADQRSGGRPHLVVLTLTGGISMQGGGLFGGGGITASGLTKTIRRLEKDDSVEAVVLRIDSPGGSALASDLLWHELRELAKKKKVVASVGDMAASGGYYLAVAADTIVAERTSIVGSIGVVGGKFTIDQALEEFGVTSETFPANPNEGAAARAAYLSPLVPWDSATRERVRQQMRGVYDLFLDRVAKGREIDVAEVRKVAQGRIWSGVQGKERKLVDEIGGLGRAIQLAREAAELDGDAPVVVEGLRDSLMEELLLSESSSSAEIAAALDRLDARRRKGIDLLARPLRPYAGSIEALAHGETLLTTLPFALVVE